MRSAAAWILAQGLSAERPLVILSDNGIEHALLTLACLHVGIPYAAISPAYSLMSQDFDKLRALVTRLRARPPCSPPRRPLAPALAAIEPLHEAALVASAMRAGLPAGRCRFAACWQRPKSRRCKRAFEAVGAGHVAKFLFTSGSISKPKAVINTQRMLTASRSRPRRRLWPFLTRTPPVILDWLPWSHTFGGNHNFNLVLRNGGTLYIDGGKPAPGLFGRQLANLRNVDADGVLQRAARLRHAGRGVARRRRAAPQFLHD